MEKRICNGFLAIMTAVLCLTFVSQAGADAEQDYVDRVLADNPLLYLRFEDASMSDGSPVADLGSLGLGGTYNSRGGADSISGFAGGANLGQACYLGQGATGGGNGDSIMVDISGPGLRLLDVTYEAYIRIQGDITTYSRIFQTGGDWLNFTSPGVMMNSYNSIPPNGEYGVMGGGGDDGGDDCAYFGPGSGPTDDGAWHHVVVTFDSLGPGVSKTLYVDGVMRNITSVITAPNDLSYTFGQLTIGAEGNTGWIGNVLFGFVDEFAVYEGVLGADRVAAHYNASGIPEPATLALLGLGGLALIRKRR